MDPLLEEPLMALTITLDDATVASLLEQVRQSLPVGLVDFADSLNIGATFEVWRLRNVADKPPDNDNPDIPDFAVPAGAFHHQLLGGKEPVGFVRSEPSTDGSLSVMRVMKSGLGASIEKALADVAVVEQSGQPLRVLSSSPNHLLAFWVPGGANRCYVVASPGSFQSLRPGRRFDGKEFLQQLSTEPE